MLSYLEKEWSPKVASDFLLKIDHRIKLLVKYPEIGTLSVKVKDVRGVLITRHNKMYYKVKKNKIIILNLYDTRTNPKKIRY